MLEKIFAFANAETYCAQLRALGKRIVLCHGVFDLLHIGHIRYLHGAKEHGDVLFVSITPDRFVDKGPGRPAFPETLRAEALAALDVVDGVFVNAWPTAEETLRRINPHVYAKGAEFKDTQGDPTGKIGLEAAVAGELGIELVFVDDIVFSSSNLINRFFSSLAQETQDYLQIFRSAYSLDNILDYLDQLQSLQALVVGDVILDAYTYCNPIGKSSKDPVLAVQFQAQDVFCGGSLAVANHVAQFAGKTGICTLLGDDDGEAYVRKNSHENLDCAFIIRPHAPTVRKERFLDGYSLQKMLEVYHMDSSLLPDAVRAELIAALEQRLPQCDLVLAADFGHGAICAEMVDILCKTAPYLAVNTQANAGNRGFHTINRYPRADYISLAEHEIRLEFRDMHGDVEPMMRKVVERTGCAVLVVTEGRRGCAIMDATGNLTRVPAFAARVVDRVGAGDAFFSVTALAAKLKFPLPVIGFLGNVVGAIAVETVGNQKPVHAQTVRKFVTALLK